MGAFTDMRRIVVLLAVMAAPVPAWAQATGDPVMVSTALAELARARLRVLDAEAPAERAPRRIPAFGACVRPDAAERARLHAVIHGWIDRTDRADRRGRIPVLRYGCLDEHGIVVDASVELYTSATRRIGRSWTLRVAGDAVHVIAAASTTASDDVMEWAPLASTQVLALADLDGDGRLDAIRTENVGEGGGSDHHTVTIVDGATGRERRVGGHAGTLVLARLQPRAGALPVVLRLAHDFGYGTPFYRCVGATGWSPCPAGERAARFDAAVAAAEAALRPVTTPLDTDTTARALDLLDVPAADRTRLLALLGPPTTATRVKRFAADRDARRRAFTEEELAAATAAEDTALATRVAAAMDVTLCPEARPAEARAAVRTLAAWITTHEAARLTALAACGPNQPCALGEGDPQLRLVETCVSPRGSYWHASWNHRYADGHAFLRQALFFVAPGAPDPALLLDIVVPADWSGDLYPQRDDHLAAKLTLDGGAPTALVSGPFAGGMLTAFAGATVTGTRHVAGARTEWHAPMPAHEAWLRRVPLVREDDHRSRRVTYWRATAAGVTAATQYTTHLLSPPPPPDPIAAILAPIDRLALAESVAGTADDTLLRDFAYHAEVGAALGLLGAPPALVAAFTAAP